MPSLTWHETLHSELRRQGLPAGVVARLLEEFADHRDDLLGERREDGTMECTQAAEAQLGHPDVLVRLAVAEHRRGSFIGRHPVLWCLVAPIPLAILCCVALMLAAIGLMSVLAWILGDAFQLEGKTTAEWPALAVPSIHGFVYVVHLGPTLLAAVLSCWFSRRAGLSWRWSFASCALIAMLAAAFTVQLQLPETPGGGNLTLGLGWPLSWAGLAQAALPASVGVVAWTLARRQRGIVAS